MWLGCASNRTRALRRREVRTSAPCDGVMVEHRRGSGECKMYLICQLCMYIMCYLGQKITQPRIMWVGDDILSLLQPPMAWCVYINRDVSSNHLHISHLPIFHRRCHTYRFSASAFTSVFRCRHVHASDHLYIQRAQTSVHAITLSLTHYSLTGKKPWSGKYVSLSGCLTRLLCMASLVLRVWVCMLYVVIRGTDTTHLVRKEGRIAHAVAPTPSSSN